MVETQFRFRADEPVSDPAVTVDAFVSDQWGQANAAAVQFSLLFSFLS